MSEDAEKPGRPQVSVVIPTFRRPETTVRAVRGVLAQTYAELDVIVVDDYSGDGTAEAVERLADQLGETRIRVLRLEKNSGPGEARNRGMAEARGEFIAFLDSDDELEPESIERRVQFLRVNPECPLVYSRMQYALSDRVRPTVPREPLGAAERQGAGFTNALIVRRGLGTSAMMGRAEAMRRCPFDPRLKGVDDWHFALEMAKTGPIGFVPEALTIVHAENEAEGERVTFDIDAESERLFIELHRAEFDAAPRAEAAVLYKLAMRAIRTGQRNLARDYLVRVRMLDPADRKARVILAIVRVGLGGALPALLKLRWKLILALGLLR